MAYSDAERHCANSKPTLPFSNLVDLRSGGVYILSIYSSFTNALPWITNCKVYAYCCPTKTIVFVLFLPRQCWATKPYLMRSCIVLVPCQLRHDSVWNRLNPFDSVADKKCVLKESRLCGIFAASKLGNQVLILFLHPVPFYMKPVNILEIFHLGRLQSIVKE